MCLSKNDFFMSVYVSCNKNDLFLFKTALRKLCSWFAKGLPYYAHSSFRLQKYNTRGEENKFLASYFLSFFVVAQKVEGGRLPSAHSPACLMPTHTATLCPLIQQSFANSSLCLLPIRLYVFWGMVKKLKG